MARVPHDAELVEITVVHGMAERDDLRVVAAFAPELASPVVGASTDIAWRGKVGIIRRRHFPVYFRKYNDYNDTYKVLYSSKCRTI